MSVRSAVVAVKQMNVNGLGGCFRESTTRKATTDQESAPVEHVRSSSSSPPSALLPDSVEHHALDPTHVTDVLQGIAFDQNSLRAFLLQRCPDDRRCESNERSPSFRQRSPASESDPTRRVARARVDKPSLAFACGTSECEPTTIFAPAFFASPTNASICLNACT